VTQREEALLDRLRQATLALRKTQAERDTLEREKVEPIAIVGIGCRFPGGADGPEAFWQLLDAGRDAVQSLDQRWTLIGVHPSADVPRWAGLLTGAVDGFDAAFFGTAPREARSLDPQHRLLLEVAWEALEDAGVPPPLLARSRTGVFVGACTSDYLHTVARQPREEQDAYSTTGNMLSIAAGRLSYTLGLEGPCLTLDTACSSSLVAIHLACRSLRVLESDLTLAGGVNMLLSPDTMEGLARTQALSPDGRCKTFDASANGFVRGEGCGLIVLKRLRDAQRDGDRLWALIRGSAVNQDGRSTGLTAPNVLAQQALLRDALQNARITPPGVGYVETHGTGTSLGDPIEVEALRAVVGPARPDGSRCVLGAVKTNLGHLEAAAGVAGLIKTALALRHERIPKNLNYRTRNAHIEIEGTALTLATEPVPWPRTNRPRVAGVSSFGISGTNAHVVLEEAPVVEPRKAAPERPSELVVLTARSAAALSAQAARLCEHLSAHPSLCLSDVAFSLATTRSPMEQRLAVAVTSREALEAALEMAAKGKTPPGAVRGHVGTGGVPKVVFVFSGQGSQWVGMGQKLLGEEPFRTALEACDRAIQAEAGFSLLSELAASAATSQQGRIDVVQPLLFAMAVALSALWRSWGVEPDAVVGHSMGEVAAAHVVGSLSLKDAAAGDLPAQSSAQAPDGSRCDGGGGARHGGRGAFAHALRWADHGRGKQRPADHAAVGRDGSARGAAFRAARTRRLWSSGPRDGPIARSAGGFLACGCA
jgi:acyl transferase domain-containing protein